MLTINKPDPHKLPERLPPDVHFACEVSTIIEQVMNDTWDWGTTTAQLVRLVQLSGDDKPSAGLTSLDWAFNGPVADTVEQLKLLGESVQLDGPSGRHIGLVLVCEVWRLRADVEQELSELVDGTAQEQRPKESRVAIGALTNGWHLSLARLRGDAPVLRVARPQDALPREHFAESMLEQLHRLNRYLLTEAQP